MDVSTRRVTAAALREVVRRSQVTTPAGVQKAVCGLDIHDLLSPLLVQRRQVLRNARHFPGTSALRPYVEASFSNAVGSDLTFGRRVY